MPAAPNRTVTPWLHFAETRIHAPGLAAPGRFVRVRRTGRVTLCTLTSVNHGLTKAVPLPGAPIDVPHNRFVGPSAESLAHADRTRQHATMATSAERTVTARRLVAGPTGGTVATWKVRTA